MPVTIVTDDIERPELDQRTYRLVRLENDLEALLVHDPDTDKASAALDVHVGHLSDPWDAAGLAHFCEHLLFMGTEKYPKENDYSEYLSAHNGTSNAYTGTVDTNYFFDVGHEYLEPALDRFSQFFICPLFLESCKDRELLAVDSENKKNLQNDMWRSYQLEKSLSNPDHVYSKFGTGNLDTLKLVPESLGKDVRDELLKFHKQLYSANQMRLVLLGRHSLDELQALAENKFNIIANKKIDRPYFDGEILRPGKELGMVYTFKPVKEVRNLEMCFPIPDCDEMWRSQPSHYISHLIGHEGEGSILSHLKEQGWVLYLGAGGSDASPGTDFFKINMELTESGCANWERIVEVIFAYITIIKKEGVQKWIFDELRLTSEAQFRFKEISPASRFTSSTAGKLHSAIDKKFILGTSVPREFREAEIRRVLDALNHNNFRVALADPAVAGELQTERHYGTQYRIDRLSDELISNCSPTSPLRFVALHMPVKNEFIPENFETNRKDVERKAKRPLLIKHTPLTRVWHKKDDTFWVPKANYLILLRNPVIGQSPEHAVMTKLFIELLKDSLNEFAYNADIAGLQYAIEPTVGAFTVTFSGYNDKLAVLAEKVFTRMKYLDIALDRYNIEKDRIERDLKNFDYETPYSQVTYHMSYVLSHGAWSKDSQVAALADVTLEKMQQFSASIFDRLHIELLAHGNVTENEALTMSQSIEDILVSRRSAPGNTGTKQSVILLKTKSVPNDPYERAFLERGVQPYFVPVLDHAMVHLDLLQQKCAEARESYSGLILTSQRSVEAFDSILGNLVSVARNALLQMPVYTVGPATCKAIQDLGFSNVLGAESGNGDALATYIIEQRSAEETRPLFFAVGDKRRDIISRRMASESVPLEELIVYQTGTAESFPADFENTVAQASTVDWLVFFSPAGADVALGYMRRSNNTTKIATIGPTTEEYLLKQWQITPAVVSAKPEPESLVVALLGSSEVSSAVLPAEETVSRCALWLPTGSHSASRTLIDPSNTNSCIEYFVQFGPTTDSQKRALGSLLAQIGSEPAFHQLRTVEQLGYIVSSGMKITLTSCGFRILIQSERDSDFLGARIDAYLDYFKNFLHEMTDDFFEKQKASLIDKLNEKLKNLSQETKRYWQQISSCMYNFDEVDEQTTLLKSITREQVSNFFNKYVHYTSEERRHFSMTMDAQNITKDTTERAYETTRVADVENFKKNCEVMYRDTMRVNYGLFCDRGTDSKL